MVVARVSQGGFQHGVFELVVFSKSGSVGGARYIGLSPAQPYNTGGTSDSQDASNPRLSSPSSDLRPLSMSSPPPYRLPPSSTGSRLSNDTLSTIIPTLPSISDADRLYLSNGELFVAMPLVRYQGMSTRAYPRVLPTIAENNSSRGSTCRRPDTARADVFSPIHHRHAMARPEPRDITDNGRVSRRLPRARRESPFRAWDRRSQACRHRRSPSCARRSCCEYIG